MVANRRFHLRMVRLGKELAVDVVDEGQPLALQPIRFLGPDVVHRFFAAGVNNRPLMNGRQEAVAEHVAPAQRNAAAAENDKPRQVPVFAPQSIGRPRTDARETGKRTARVHEEISLCVFVEGGRHRANDG